MKNQPRHSRFLSITLTIYLIELASRFDTAYVQETSDVLVYANPSKRVSGGEERERRGRVSPPPRWMRPPQPQRYIKSDEVPLDIRVLYERRREQNENKDGIITRSGKRFHALFSAPMTSTTPRYEYVLSPGCDGKYLVER